MTRQTTVSYPSTGRLDNELSLLTDNVETGELCDMTNKRKTSFRNGRQGDELLPLLTDDIQTGGLCDKTSNKVTSVTWQTG